MTDYKDNIEVGTSILVSGSDHSLYPMSLTTIKAVFDPKDCAWYKYTEEDYLEDGQEVYTVWGLK